MRLIYYITLGCLVLFHSPDGSDLWVNTQQIVAARPAAGVTEGHVVKGTRTILYMPGKIFGVQESPEEVSQARAQVCEEHYL